MSESETPKTDAAAECLPIYGPSDAEYVPADFARELERDLTASQARVRVLGDALREAKGMLDAMPREHNDHSREQYRYCVACAVSRTIELARAALGETGERKA